MYLRASIFLGGVPHQGEFKNAIKICQPEVGRNFVQKKSGGGLLLSKALRLFLPASRFWAFHGIRNSKQRKEMDTVLGKEYVRVLVFFFGSLLDSSCHLERAGATSLA
jgi:hypothetical protein